ncbi:hypothetical protein RHGRI_003700 [Rhododendron griersonianum]|uniref:Secreted protein n=1 Tax=Rhododendron griersonianum TaxID=479676 RepID=A0AAV6L5Y5_9ERIC|nr:hypothetical protein RHGRI_003700 [Rhododendron griersonianum]
MCVYPGCVLRCSGCCFSAVKLVENGTHAMFSGTIICSRSTLFSEVLFITTLKVLCWPLCWVEHMSLDNETGLDPPGIRVRAVSGLVAADYFAPRYLFGQF